METQGNVGPPGWEGDWNGEGDYALGIISIIRLALFFLDF